MSSNSTASHQSMSQPTSSSFTGQPSQPLAIAQRSGSRSQSISQSNGSLSSSMPGSPSGLSVLQNSNIPFLRRLFPPPPVLSTSVPDKPVVSSMNQSMNQSMNRHGPMPLSYRRHSIDVASLRSMRAEAEEASHSAKPSAFADGPADGFSDDSVDATSLSAKPAPSRMLEGFCKYEWDFSG